jgi:D-alanyl-D-alanine carboxypeptidase (penicillin-binding protein 5/6)
MPLTRRQTYRRRRITVFSTLAVVLAGLVYGVSTGVAPLPEATAVVAEPVTMTQPAVEPDWPEFGRGAIGALGFPGVLSASGDQSAVPITSITKMITALVILEKYPLAAGEAGPKIEFTDADVDIYYDVLAENGSVAPVVAGMVLTQREAFEGMLLPSANNYALSLAVWAFGSEEAYLQAAEAWLAARGLTATTVADTSGLSPNSVSTPAELVEIGKLVVGTPALAEIVAMPRADLPTVGMVTNTNKMLGELGVDGIKTGTTDEAGACLLFSSDVTVGSQSVTIVGVALGGDTHAELDRGIATLLESMKPGFHEVTLTEAGTAFADYTTEWGEGARAVAAEAASVLVWSDTPITGVATATPVDSATEGEKVGSVDFTVGEKTVTVPLALDTALTDPGLGWRLTHPGELAG